MNAENFSEYLKNPSQLYQVSYQELKSLVLQYPYSPNLRYLLMRKAKMENREDYDRLLGMASTYSIDRSFLFKKMKADRLIPEFEENYELNEEYLELKDLATLEVEPEIAQEAANSTTDELAFALDDLIEKPQETEIAPPPSNAKADNLAEEETESLLERLLDGDFTDVEATEEHEALNNLSLADIAKANHTSDNNAVEELMIEDSLEELAEKSDLIQQFEANLQDDLLKEETDGLPKSEIEKEIEAEIQAQLASNQVVDQAPIPEEVDIDVEEEGQIIEQERFPDLQLTPLNEAEETPQAVAQNELKIVEEDDDDDTPTLDDLRKKQSGQPKPLPKSSFNSWLQQYKSPLLDHKMNEFKEVSDKPSKKKKKKGKKKDKDTLVIAKASVKEDNEIATETLASLLEKQGHYGRAIRMYKTLSLRNPEKNSFFAAKIEALQKLRNEE